MTWKRMLLVTLMVGLGAWASACSSLFSKCGPSNCTGCCDATGTCQAAAADHCGLSGATCTACVGLQQCIAGACGFPGSGNNGGSGSGSGSSTSTSGSTGTTGTTGNCAALGATCTSNSQCCSGDCLSGHCYGTATSTGSSGTTGSCQGYGGNCTSSGQCCSGLTCNSGSCTYSSTTGSTTGTTGGCLTYGRSCTSSSQCCSGLTCNGSYCTYTSGTTGTTGTTGSSGTTGSQCGTCPDGTNCTMYGGGQTGIGVYYECTCTEANSQTQVSDSCTANTNGKTVCDNGTLNCRAPRDYDRCNPVNCDTGFDCVGFYLYPDGGGTEYRCLQNCTTSADCSSVMTSCDPQALSQRLPDGGTQAIGACIQNLCGPGSLDDGGMTNGDFFQPCRGHGLSDGGLDGVCQPLFVSTLTNKPLGVCLASGPLNTNGKCSGFGGNVSGGCVAGEFCISTGLANGTGANQQATACVPTCNANAASGQPYDQTCPGSATCHAFDSAVASGLSVGFCG